MAEGKIDVLRLRSSLIGRFYAKMAGRPSRVCGLRFRNGGYRLQLEYQGAVRRTQADVLWSLGGGLPTAEIPYFLTIFDLQHILQPWFPEVSANGTWEGREWYYRTVLRMASGLFTGTECGKEEIQRHYGIPSGRIHVVPFPSPRMYESDRSTNVTSVRIRYRLPTNYVFYPAQFWPHKNHVAILRAVKIVRERWGQTIGAVFCGSDRCNNRAHIEKTARILGVSDLIQFLGFVPAEDLVGLYQGAHALVFSSYFGPDNLPPLEAFAAGCPVIASDVPGAREQLGDAAMFFAPSDAEQLAHRIHTLSQDPIMRHSIIELGAARAGRWSGTDYVQKVLSIFDKFSAVRECWPSD